MEMFFETKGLNNYLNVFVDIKNKIWEGGYRFRVEMLEENDIPHLLPVTHSEIDARILMHYDTAHMYVLARMFQKQKPNEVILMKIMDALKSCALLLEEYLLVLEDLIFDADYMFFDYEKKEICFVYAPGYDRDIREQLKDFFEKLMQIFDHRDRTGVMLLYQLYDEVLDEETDFLDVLRKADYEMAGVLQLPGTVPAEREEEKNITFVEEPKTDYGVVDEMYRLVPLTSGALKDLVIAPDAGTVSIGRGKKESDYRIKSTQISRLQAILYREPQGLFVEDQDSTNGTYLNAVRILPRQKIKIGKGDILGFANEEFFVS